MQQSLGSIDSRQCYIQGILEMWCGITPQGLGCQIGGHGTNWATFNRNGTVAPKNFRSPERKYHGIRELSLQGTFAPWNFRPRERTFAPTTFVHGYVRIRGCIPV